MIGGYEETDDEGAKDVEEEDTDIDTTDGLWKVPAWILCFTSGNSDNLGANERESRLCHDRPPAKETASRTTDIIELNERAGVMPVPEPKSVMIGTTSKIKDNSENLSARAVHVRSLRRKYNSTNNEARYSHDLDGRENKFAFTIGAWSGEK